MADCSNSLICAKLSNIIKQMEKEGSGVRLLKQVKTRKESLENVFTKNGGVQWLRKHRDIKQEEEASHLFNFLVAYGYVYSVSDLKESCSYFKFQKKEFWPSNQKNHSDNDYAVYLLKRKQLSKTNCGLDERELRLLDYLQNSSENWQKIKSRADQEIEKEKQIGQCRSYQRQKKVFWSIYRPKPSQINVLEEAIYKKMSRQKSQTSYPSSSYSTGSRSASLDKEKPSASMLEELYEQLKRHRMKTSVVCESIILFTKLQIENDSFFALEKSPNPWLDEKRAFSDDVSGDVTPGRARPWSFSFNILLQDERGRSKFREFLESEFSLENFDFYMACNKLKRQPANEVKRTVKKMFDTYISKNAPNSINIDFPTKKAVVENMKNPTRFCFEEAQNHVFGLMKNDCYVRFLKSDTYRNLFKPSH